LNRCTVMDVCLQGGEPFLRKDLTDLILGIVKNRMRFTILTNGTLITEDVAAFIASTGRCNNIQVSIDGSTPPTHDACRGQGNFYRAVQGLKILLKYKIPATVRVTIHRQNVTDLEAVARLLLDDFQLPSFSTNSASHLGLCRKNAEQVQLTVEERSLAMKTLLRLSETYNGRIGAAAGPLAEAQGYLQMEQARKEGLDRLPRRGFLSGCNGPTEKMAVRSDGTMLVCAQMPSMELGRINRDDLRQVWNDHPILDRFRRRSEISLSDFAFCSGCPYVNYCSGNCPAIAQTTVADPWHPSPDACYRRFLEAGGILPEM
jgi:SynChlorMet cassette radical SAM/SPASM protein ScmE